MVLFFVISLCWVSLFPGDVVELYLNKVKGFESVYYLEEDDEWYRDRRIFELFGRYEGGTDQLENENKYAGGILANYRFETMKTQLGLFTIFSGERALLGTKWSYRDYIDFSIGTLVEGRAELFFEINSPRFFSRTNYLFDFITNRFKRVDFRFYFDTSRYFDELSIGPIFHPGEEERWEGRLDLLRFGIGRWRLLSFMMRASENGNSSIRTGLDWIYQSKEDFNLTRRGHFGTSFGIKLLYLFSNLEGMKEGEEFSEGSKGSRQGFYGNLHFQVPAKWFLTLVTGAGAAYASMKTDNHELVKVWGEGILKPTLREPRDILFVRFSMDYRINDPETVSKEKRRELFMNDDVHALTLSIGIVY